MKKALTIAGSDSCGGAGIQADIKTMTLNGVYAMSVITALTAQNTTGVRDVLEASPEFVKEQIDAVYEDIRPDAVKIGMVSSPEIVSAIAERLKAHKAENIVVDPVMVATSGASLMKTEAISALCRELLPLCTVVTPNIPEAEVLSDMKIKDKADMEKAAKKINETYGCAVLLKGGHSVNDANDLLCKNGELTLFTGKRINNPNTHGTGCTLSSAIAANLAKGYDMKMSVGRAKDYISGALAAQLDLGKGKGPMAHNFDLAGKFAEAPAEEAPAEPFSTTFDNATGFSL
ncbi:MAG: bifunctional hydroxymethylpyrimidine kinase/phosphomethylpyrimidine kinase, partial [Clostridia bacterium]|nr:bifunctional hydroxymethylpyrimidine kinase/phosphomethylpyrimidine kinase [Clostridia bacterium]